MKSFNKLITLTIFFFLLNIQLLFLSYFVSVYGTFFYISLHLFEVDLNKNCHFHSEYISIKKYRKFYGSKWKVKYKNWIYYGHFKCFSVLRLAVRIFIRTDLFSPLAKVRLNCFFSLFYLDLTLIEAFGNYRFIDVYFDFFASFFLSLLLQIFFSFAVLFISIIFLLLYVSAVW